ncbi:hypothetical protein AB2N04_02485 [Nitratireductor sp. GISD-1A_MAKvit]|uniref:hypothetical protein n=1 Tax=Nitratireductor sp. GISD-1A_MAKvit TaxID=3234198 RepID=UPI0034650016
MLRSISVTGVVVAMLVLCAVLFAIGWFTRVDPSDAPFVKVLGGGFIFNYREGEVFYGFTAQVMRPLASGSVIEATFEDPAGGKPYVVSERVSTMTDRYALRTPAVRGVEAKKPYEVSIRLYDREKSRMIWETETTFVSQISDGVVPDQPLTVGPGYHLNPD